MQLIPQPSFYILNFDLRSLLVSPTKMLFLSTIKIISFPNVNKFISYRINNCIYSIHMENIL